MPAAFVLAALVALTALALHLLERRRAERTWTTIVDPVEGWTTEVPYPPEDVVFGMDVNPRTGREVVTVAVRQADGKLHIIMMHERTADDE